MTSKYAMRYDDKMSNDMKGMIAGEGLSSLIALFEVDVSV